VKIKNWSSCVPEEVRKNEDFMPIYPFERLVYPQKIGSPFVGTNAVKGPGGIGEPIERAQGEKIEGGGTGRKKAKRNIESEAMTNSGVDRNTPAPIASTAAYSQLSSVQHSPPKSHTQEDARDRTMLAAAGTLTVPPIVDKLPSETSRCFVLLP
jgi:chromatin structure-remodeling complex subunit RSC1/2